MTDTLTSKQKKFLEECEEEFEDRYTEKDDDFTKFKKQGPKRPPIVDPWHNKSRRQEWPRQHQTHGRRNHYYDRRHERNDRYERNERHERHAGKHFMHQRQRMY